jgi:hypothetical protein
MKNNQRTNLVIDTLYDVLKKKQENDQQALDNIFNGRYGTYKQKVQLVGVLPLGLTAKPETEVIEDTPPEGLLLPTINRTTDLTTLSVKVLDQRMFTNGYVYQWSEDTFWEFEDKYSKEFGVIMHGNFGAIMESKHEWYQRYWWSSLVYHD